MIELKLIGQIMWYYLVMLYLLVHILRQEPLYGFELQERCILLRPDQRWGQVEGEWEVRGPYNTWVRIR